MRAIIISDADARALVDQLQLAKLYEGQAIRVNPDRPPTLDEMHRVFHHIVVRWLQDQGASVTR